MNRGRLLLVATAMALLASVIVVPWSPPARAACGTSVDHGPDRWRVLPRPQFPAGEPATLWEMDVARNTPDVVVVANGRSVLRTTDGGCTWVTIWTGPPDAPAVAGMKFNGPQAVIGVAVPADGAIEHVHLLLGDAGGVAAGSVRTVHSYDGGRTWAVPTAPSAPASGYSGSGRCGQNVACDLSVAAADPQRLFLRVGASAFGPEQLWRSDDAGRTWAMATSSATHDDEDPRNLLAAASPADADNVTAVIGCRTGGRSDDGGRTFSPMALPLPERSPAVGLAVAQASTTQETTILVAHHGRYCVGDKVSGLLRSGDGGKSWKTTATPAIQDQPGLQGNFSALALDRTGEMGVVLTGRRESGTWVGHAWLVDERLDLLELTPPVDGVLDVVGLGDGGRSFAVLGTDGVAILRTVRRHVTGGETVVVDINDPSSRKPAVPKVADARMLCREGENAVVRRGAWTVAAAPTFPQPPDLAAAQREAIDAKRAQQIQRIADLAVDPVDRRTAWVTNGWSVLRTDDGGCTWALAYELPQTPSAQQPFTAAGARIVELEAPRSESGRGRLAVVVVDREASTSPQPWVVTTADAGRTWSLSGGLPPSTWSPKGNRCRGDSGCRLAISPSDPDTMYLSLQGAVFLTGPPVLYASSDGGRTWTPRSVPDGPTDVTSFRIFDDLAVDPVDDSRLWGTFGTGRQRALWASPDGGRTWQFVPAATSLSAGTPGVLGVGPGQVTLLDVGGFESGNGWLRSRDGGATFDYRFATGLGAGPRSIVTGADSDTFVVTADTGVFTYVPWLDRWVDVNVLDLPALDDAQADAGDPARFAFRTDDLIVWLDRKAVPPVEVPVEPLPRYDVPPLRDPDPAAFLPPRRRVDLDVGQTTTVRFELDLPARPTPLDVAFLLDASGSMGDDHRALAHGLERIVGDLADARIPVAFALAEYRDWDLRYRLLHQMAPPTGELVRKLRSIRSAGGTEPAYTALYQLVTGAGQKATVGAPVPAGQQVRWRDARRYVVHVTDEPLQPDPDGPDPVTATQALIDERVGHIGLIANPPPEVGADGDALMRTQMQVLSLQTGALAPPGGVDCDGDGDPDLAEGDPIVCNVAEAKGHPDLATPLLEILLALEDRQPLTFKVSDPAIATDVTATVAVDDLDVTVPHRIPVEMTVVCTPAQAGLVNNVSLTATLRSATIASAVAKVGCAAPASPALAGPPAVPPPGEAPEPANAPGEGPRLTDVPRPTSGIVALPPGAGAPLPIPASASA
ncbi:MAG TPA: hypothetical protein VM307_07435, partial [Egibacteraceae bacterium]|nr:hypothetical protein [Egibacteraceae bacterium]